MQETFASLRMKIFPFASYFNLFWWRFDELMGKKI